MITISSRISLNETEVQFTFIRSPGPGGQNVNKVATGVQLRFNVRNSLSFTEEIKRRLLAKLENKLTTQGDLIIKATRYRRQEQNKQDALDRLIQLLKCASIIPKYRRKTKPTYSSVQKRLTKKKLHGAKKTLRQSNLD